uniref:hypothetical protein n=1 Tax=Rhodococcus qingshengii TaxID=334542 RepID=UPI0036F20344
MSGISLDSSTKLIVGWFPAVAAVVLLVWDLWAWRLPLLNRLTHRPRIDGLWEVTLTPTDESHIPPGGNRGPIPAYVVISQSYWSLHVRQMTAESGSDRKSFFWDKIPGLDVERLSYLYQNDPRPEHLSRSPKHAGSCSFDTARLVPSEIRGVYFTDWACLHSRASHYCLSLENPAKSAQPCAHSIHEPRQGKPLLATLGHPRPVSAGPGRGTWNGELEAM